MKIAEIREAYRALNWQRIDCSGSTREEFRRRKVPMVLLPYITAVQDLKVPPRFKDDIDAIKYALSQANRTIEKWEAMQ